MATLYADNISGTTIPNPLTAASGNYVLFPYAGSFIFYAVQGLYDLLIPVGDDFAIVTVSLPISPVVCGQTVGPWRFGTPGPGWDLVDPSTYGR